MPGSLLRAATITVLWVQILHFPLQAPGEDGDEVRISTSQLGKREWRMRIKECEDMHQEGAS
jgi:hypothetical protein